MFKFNKNGLILLSSLQKTKLSGGFNNGVILLSFLKKKLSGTFKKIHFQELYKNSCHLVIFCNILGSVERTIIRKIEHSEKNCHFLRVCK